MTCDGPLKGLRVIEFSGIGPAPFAAMLLADMGADVIRIDRPNAPIEYVLARGKRSIALDMKQAADREMAIELIGEAEILIEGFRPGVMERLGLGPEPMLATNSKLVYGRMTGWGQYGPLAQAAGHDLNYIAISGALHAIGLAEGPPLPPLNLVGDFGGGSLYLVMGLLAALSHARATGQGQVVDAAMSDGASSLMGLFYGLKARGEWNDARSANFLDGAAPYYRCYRCADGGWVSIAAIEPQFWAQLRERVGLIDPLFDRRDDTASWPEMSQALENIFATRTRDQWCDLLEGSDACFAPVLSLSEAPLHPHNQARGTFTSDAQAAPAPRFSVTPARNGDDPPLTDADREAIIRDWLQR
ncbi:CoA transferase [Novosphingobium sp. ERN07]|uniref:CaiB/BaiF CoA transferase family protein n=1 Tax=unclassified Novosphingobium TaxID=2644732 RepID=UPI000E4B4229|nr:MULTISPECIES: CaiB/BaiF CoA-transferase family protein [unclassified Novosphingobium]AXU20210.1 carnitine dehydratase [Novosphingobium sp. THN1]NLR41078.1 CoA transferase [Novosphingobium sp. ERW19]NLR70829.1 CoA transferase [Novosphingobium sp. ERN07]